MTAQKSPRRRETSGAIKLGIAISLCHRRQTSLRCTPLDDGRRDPLDPIPPLYSTAPMVAGLEPWELAAEGRRLQQLGWHPWEIRARLGKRWRRGGGR
jgi:hypothetical protein